MIKTEVVAPGVLKIIAPEKLNAGDFADLAPQVESIMKQQRQIRLLIDAARLEGWENITALEEHAAWRERTCDCDAGAFQASRLRCRKDDQP